MTVSERPFLSASLRLCASHSPSSKCMDTAEPVRGDTGIGGDPHDGSERPFRARAARVHVDPGFHPGLSPLAPSGPVAIDSPETLELPTPPRFKLESENLKLPPSPLRAPSSLRFLLWPTLRSPRTVSLCSPSSKECRKQERDESRGRSRESAARRPRGTPNDIRTRS
jgi:hypothetical protein